MRILLLLMGLLMLQSCGKVEVVTESETQTQETTVVETVPEEKQEAKVVEEPEITEIPEIEVQNNGGTVVEYNGVTYFTKQDEDEPTDSNIDAIYAMSENSTEKFVEINSGSLQRIFIDDGNMYYTDRTDSDFYVVKVSLETQEKEYLQKGGIVYLDTESNQIFYSVLNFYENADYDNNIYKMDFNGENVVELAKGQYTFLSKVDDIVYLEELTNDNKIILASVNEDGTGLKTVVETKAGGYIADPEEFAKFEDIYGYRSQFIVDFGVYNENIYFTIGGYEGSARFYFGGLVKVGTSGEGFEPILEGVESFDIIDNNMYYYDYDIETETAGTSKYNLDTKELTFISGLFSVEATGEQNLYLNSKKDTDNGISTYDLTMYNTENGEVKTIFDGSTAPFKEDSESIGYKKVEVVGDYVYFNMYVHGYKDMVDGWRGHTCYLGYYRVKNDGSGLELIYIDPNVVCTE